MCMLRGSGASQPTAMRVASWNIDVAASGMTGDLTAVARLVRQVDVLALQEMGAWDTGYTEEPQQHRSVMIIVDHGKGLRGGVSP